VRLRDLPVYVEPEWLGKAGLPEVGSQEAC